MKQLIFTLFFTVTLFCVSCGGKDNVPDEPDSKTQRKDFNDGYYLGEFNDKGEPHGNGTYYWNNGNQYTGQWENGQRSGNGTFTFKDGTTFTCVWKDDKPTDEKCSLLLYLKDWYYWNKETGKIDVNQYASAEAMLDKLKNPDDNLSKIIQLDVTSNDLLFDEGKELGYGLEVRWDVYDDLRVAYVYEGSPAGLAGIKRGWKVLKINAADVNTLSTINLSASKEGESIAFNLEDEKGASKTITLVSKIFDTQSVLYQNTYQLPAKKAGYLVLKSFAQQHANEITQSINALIAAGIQELILDLRYCSLGSCETLTGFAGIILPSAANNKTFLTRKYNADHAANDSVYTVKKSGSLNLNRILVLTTSSTAGLSELLLLGLAPYTEIIQIGDKTGGVDYYGTSAWTLNEKKKLALVTSDFQNASDKTVTGARISDYSTFDGVDKGWGDENEELLKNALYYSVYNYFPVSRNAVGKLVSQNNKNKIINR